MGSEEKKISLARKELYEVVFPKWYCLGRYNQTGCGMKCSKRTHLLCLKVSTFLRKAR